MAQKFHHKLFYLNRYLRKDFAVVSKDNSNPKQIIELATTVLGLSLNDNQKAQKMYKLMKQSFKFFNKHSKGYSLKVAIFASRHKVLDSDDYQKLNQAIKKIPKLYQEAQSQAPIKPKLLARIF